MTTAPKTTNNSGYYTPTPADATHQLDDHEPVTNVRPAHQVEHEIERTDHDAIIHARPLVLYPQINRATMREHGLYLVHNIPTGQDDFNGDLIVSGNRLAPLHA